MVSGAGVSAESGLATFRTESEEALREFGDNPPLWSRFNPVDLATAGAYQRDPAMVSHWYDWRRGQGARAKPNPGHEALALLERRLEADGGEFTLLTQNIDGLHQAAGSRNVVELHGSLWMWRCLSCGDEREDRDPPFESHPPRCAACAEGIRRPSIVWFGEALPADAVRAAAEAVDACDLFMSVGTSAVVYPAAGFAEAAAMRGVPTIEVNLEATPLSPLVSWSIPGRSGEVLPALLAAAFGG